MFEVPASKERVTRTLRHSARRKCDIRSLCSSSFQNIVQQGSAVSFAKTKILNGAVHLRCFNAIMSLEIL